MAQITKYNFCELPPGQGDIQKLTEKDYRRYKKPNQKEKLTWEEIGFKKDSEEKIKNYARYVPKDCVFADIDDMMEALEFLKIVRLMKYRCLVLVTQNGMQFMFRENKNPNSFCRYQKEITGIDNWLGMNTDAKGFGGVQNIRVYGNQRKEFFSWDPIFLEKGEFASDEVKNVSDCESIDIDLLDEIPFWVLPKPKERNLFKNGEHGEIKASDDEVWVRGGKTFSNKNEEGELVKVESHTPLTVLKEMIPGDRHMYIFRHCAYFCMSNGFSLEDYKETLRMINKCYFRFNGGEMTDDELIGDADKRWSEYEEKLQKWGYIWEDKEYYWKKDKKKQKEDRKIKSINAKELLSMELKEPHIVVENMICQGLTILAGAPKVGKSWFCLDLCTSVCTGQPLLGFNTNKCDCSYFALEDSWNRLQKRLRKVLGDKDIPENFHLQINCSPLNEGLLEELENHLKEFPNVKLIIIDTLQKIRGIPGKADSMYGYDYKEMDKIKSFADEHKICIVLIHHLKKGNEDDPFDKINGSTALRGAADTTIVLSKIKDKKEVEFSMEGRDVESTEKLLLFNKETCKWEVVCSDLEALETRTDIEIYNSDPVVITIKKLLEEKPKGFEITSKDLREKIFEITKTTPEQPNPQTLTRYINEHLQAKLSKYDGIYYKKPSTNGGNKGRKMFFSQPKLEE